MRLRSFSAAILCGLFFLTLLASASTTYYVATNGNDAGSCKTAATACKTISHAVTLATTAGSTIQVGAGTYVENVTLSNPGASGANIVLTGSTTANTCPATPFTDVNSPTGNRPAPTAEINGLVTMAASYLTVNCFHIVPTGKGAVIANIATTGGVISNNNIDGTPDGAGPTAVNGGGIGFGGVDSAPAAQYAANYTISGNYIHGVSTGIWFACSSCTVTRNEITALAGDEPGVDHDYIDAWGIGSTFSHNYMHANTCNSCYGYDCHMDCIQTWNTVGNGTEVSKNMTFTRNVCFNHHEGVIVQDNAGNSDVSNWTVSNNVFAYGPYDDGSGHLCVAGPAHPWCWILEDGALGSNNNFLNNTCIDGAEGFEQNSGSAQFKDNLFLSLGSESVVYQTSGATVSGANNLYYAVDATFNGGTFPGDIFGKNPEIISAGTGSAAQQCIGCNFNIQSISAARDAGVNTGVGIDLLGTVRPQGPAYDIGAYEFIPTAKPLPPTGLGAVVH